MAKEKARVTWGLFMMFWGVIAGGVFVLAGALPVMPWRMARVDTNVGNRFVMDRYYTLFGATNQFGKSTNWFTLKTKMQRKTEEFGRPSPLTALVGTIAGAMGAGGAAMGCPTWQACKDHVASRYLSYGTVGIVGMMSFAMLLISAGLSVGTILFYNFEDGAKKSKKKKHADDLSPAAKTMIFNIFAFLTSFIGVCSFMMFLDVTLKSFKETAYYPYAASGPGPYISGFGCFILFWCMMYNINRVTPFCGKKKDADPAMGEQGAYGADAYGAYGGGDYGAPPGAYGAPPGAYGPPGGGY